MFYFGAQRVVATGGGSELPPPGVTPGLYAANDPAIAYTDCVVPSFVNGWARFQRPIADTGSDYQYCMPGARQRFKSIAPTVNVSLRWNGLVTRTDARNLIGHVFVDGVHNRDFQTPGAVNQVLTSVLTLNMGTVADRLYEIILPYADGVEFGQIQVDPAYTITAAAPRSGPLMVCLGDSITQGFLATDVRRGWPFLLAAAKGYRCINLGYGGRITVADDGTKAANLNPDLIVVLLGMNDFLSQRPLADYKTAFKQLLTNIHTVDPTVPVYIAGITLSTVVLPIPHASYSNVAGQAISELGYSQLVGVDAATLIPDSSYLSEGIHPNDAGNEHTKDGWAAAMP
ncbi:SGNH/GDSL hydrolase family protein [Bradyrhizobium liaoningense]|uniref:SGNH/GDSL hydrolase family protein n=1 Tax=Bradyrhizobium liaoningense TaxID=43992 RepID=UPI000687D03F|nr:SGNH/GDSL hydrolase family protein [Bradyrhizobium liaoningense]